jgi:hypothetical protein
LRKAAASVHAGENSPGRRCCRLRGRSWFIVSILRIVGAGATSPRRTRRNALAIGCLSVGVSRATLMSAMFVDQVGDRLDGRATPVGGAVLGNAAMMRSRMRNCSRTVRLAPSQRGAMRVLDAGIAHCRSRLMRGRPGHAEPDVLRQ